MKTYTGNEIIREASGRPETVFVSSSGYRQKYDNRGRLLLWERDGGWTLDEGGLVEDTTYTIPADNEKPVELPESVRSAAYAQNWSEPTVKILEKLWVETVKLWEASKK